MALKFGPFLVVAWLWVALGINYVDRQMVYSIFPVLKRDLLFTDAQLGLVGSLFSWVYTLAMPFAGRLADRFRRDRLIVFSILLWSLATLACGLATSLALFLAARIVLGLTQALYYPAAVGLLAAAHGDATRSRALGIHQSAQLAGIVIGGWYGGWMADHVSWRMGFAAAALVGLGYALVLHRALPASPPPVSNEPGSLADFANLFRSRCYTALAAAFFSFCAMLWIFYAWLPNYLYERFHLSMTESGFNATIFVQASCGLGVVAGGALADRLAKRTPAARFYVAAAGILLCAPFGYLTFAAPTLNLTRLYSVAYGLFSGFMVANVFAASYDVIARRHFGLGAGVLNMIGGIAASIMIYLAGALKGTIGFAGLLQWIAVACALSAVTLVFSVRHYHRMERSS
ncbi:MAG: MFS transporter [Bryobacterales bacterium]|nr:MFS transporter [Bryobacterales bacterium]